MFNNLRRGWWYFISDNTCCISNLRRGWWYFISDNTCCINEFLLLNTSSFLSPQRFSFLSTSLLFNVNLSTSSLFINFIITYHTWFHYLSNLLKTSICFQVSMLWMLVTMNKAKFKLWKILIMFYLFPSFDAVNAG